VLEGKGVTAFELSSESTDSGFGFGKGAELSEEGGSSVGKREEIVGGRVGRG